MENFVNRKRTNENKRLITILNQNGNVMEAEISEVPENVIEQGTPITAEFFNQVNQKVEAAKDVTSRVTALENKFASVSYDTTSDTYIF